MHFRCRLVLLPAIASSERVTIRLAPVLALAEPSACHVYLTYPFVLSWSCLEAMAAGCAMVASSTPPVQEFIKNNTNGLLVDFSTPASLPTP